MLAVDTNVVVRLLVADDPKQSAAASALFAREDIWIGSTVLLETDWVLRSLYRFDSKAIRGAFTLLLGLTNVQVENKSAVASALLLTEHGIEFADALHLCSRPPRSPFVSFDSTLVKRAKRAGVSDASGFEP